MLELRFTNQFKRDYELTIKRGLDISLFENVVTRLRLQGILEATLRDHKLVLTNEYHNCRECHIQLDWLLVYRVFDDELILELVRTVSHSDLFQTTLSQLPFG